MCRMKVIETDQYDTVYISQNGHELIFTFEHEGSQRRLRTAKWLNATEQAAEVYDNASPRVVTELIENAFKNTEIAHRLNEDIHAAARPYIEIMQSKAPVRNIEVRGKFV